MEQPAVVVVISRPRPSCGGVPSSTADEAASTKSAQHPVDDEARAVGAARPTCEPPRRRTRWRAPRRVRSAATTSTSGIAATGLKKCRPTTRSGCRRSAAIAVTDSAEVFVAMTQSSRTTCSSREHVLLDLEDLVDRLDDEVAVGEHRPVVGAGDEAAQAVRLVGADAPARRARRPRRRRREALVDALLVLVAHHHRHAEPAARTSSASWRGHQPGADDADLRDAAGPAPRPGRPRAASPPLHQVERVERRPRLARHDEVGECLVLGREAVLAAAVAGGLDQVEGAVGAGAAPWVRASATARRERRPSPTACVAAGSGRATATRPRTTSRGPARATRRGSRPGRAATSATPSSDRLAAVEHAVLVERVLDDDRDGVARGRPGAAAATRRPSRARGRGRPRAARRRRAGRDRAVVAVQRQLEPAADRRHR